MTKVSRPTQDPPGVVVANAGYRVRFRVYRSADNTGGLIDLYLNVEGGGPIRVDLANYTAGQWHAIDRSVPTITGALLNDYGWVYVVYGYFGAITAGYALVSDIEVESSTGPQVTWQKTTSGSYVVSPDDAGKRISISSGSVTIGSAAAVMPTGSWFEIYNNSSASISILSADGNTIRLAGTATTGTRTLAQRGVATVDKVAATEFVVRGVT